MKKQINFDIDAALKALRAGKDISGQDGVLTPLIKQLTEAAVRLEGEAYHKGYYKAFALTALSSGPPGAS